MFLLYVLHETANSFRCPSSAGDIFLAAEHTLVVRGYDCCAGSGCGECFPNIYTLTFILKAGLVFNIGCQLVFGVLVFFLQCDM